MIKIRNTNESMKRKSIKEPFIIIIMIDCMIECFGFFGSQMHTTKRIPSGIDSEADVIETWRDGIAF